MDFKILKEKVGESLHIILISENAMYSFKSVKTGRKLKIAFCIFSDKSPEERRKTQEQELIAFSEKFEEIIYTFENEEVEEGTLAIELSKSFLDSLKKETRESLRKNGYNANENDKLHFNNFLEVIGDTESKITKKGRIKILDRTGMTKMAKSKMICREIVENYPDLYFINNSIKIEGEILKIQFSFKEKAYDCEMTFKEKTITVKFGKIIKDIGIDDGENLQELKNEIKEYFKEKNRLSYLLNPPKENFNTSMKMANLQEEEINNVYDILTDNGLDPEEIDIFYKTNLNKTHNFSEKIGEIKIIRCVNLRVVVFEDGKCSILKTKEDEEKILLKIQQKEQEKLKKEMELKLKNAKNSLKKWTV